VIAILLAEVLETYSGYRGILVLHVPLAMGIFGGIMRQLFWAVRGTRLRRPPSKSANNSTG
jgi:hypothetical protein